MAASDDELGVVGGGPRTPPPPPPTRATPPLPLAVDANRAPPPGAKARPRQLPLPATATKLPARPPGAGDRYTPDEVHRYSPPPPPLLPAAAATPRMAPWPDSMLAPTVALPLRATTSASLGTLPGAGGELPGHAVPAGASHAGTSAALPSAATLAAMPSRLDSVCEPGSAGPGGPAGAPCGYTSCSHCTQLALTPPVSATSSHRLRASVRGVVVGAGLALGDGVPLYAAAVQPLGGAAHSSVSTAAAAALPHVAPSAAAQPAYVALPAAPAASSVAYSGDVHHVSPSTLTKGHGAPPTADAAATPSAPAREDRPPTLEVRFHRFTGPGPTPPRRACHTSGCSVKAT